MPDDATDCPAGEGGHLINSCPECGQHIDVSDQGPVFEGHLPGLWDADPVPGQDFDHFRIVGLVGEGGMSRVFQAEDKALGRMDALKILNREFSANADRASQLEREARITASISHPNVVTVYSTGHDQAFFYIAMELVPAAASTTGSPMASPAMKPRF